MKALVNIFIFYSLLSCSHNAKVETHSPESISNLAKTSYIRGCIEGMNKVSPLKTKGKRLTICRSLSDSHYEDILKILNGPTTEQ